MSGFHIDAFFEAISKENTQGNQMNTHDIDIELPPLPDWMSRFQIPADDLDDSDFSWLDCRMKDYARAAVEADRKRGGEPVYLYRRKGRDEFVTCDKSRYDELSSKPDQFETKVLYTAPQPAEHSKGEVVVTKTPEGEIIAVTRQDDEGRILSVIAEADSKRRGEPTAAEISDVIREITGCPDIKNGEDSLVVALGMLFHRGATPQPAESCESLMSNKTVCGSENGDCDSQPAEPDLAKCAECGAELIHVRPGKWQHPDCPQSHQAAEPVAINAIFETCEGEVIGTTEAKVKRYELQDDGSITVVIDYWPQPAEPVGYRWRDGNEDTWKYVDGLPPEDSIGHYEVELLYARAANKPAEPVKGTPSQERRAKLEQDPKKKAALGRARERLRAGEIRFEVEPLPIEPPAEPVKVPLGGDILQVWAEEVEEFPLTRAESSRLIRFARALLARYGKGAP